MIKSRISTDYYNLTDRIHYAVIGIVARSGIHVRRCAEHTYTTIIYTLVIDVRIINLVFSTFVFGDKQIINDTSYFQFNLLRAAGSVYIKRETLRDRFSIQLARARVFDNNFPIEIPRKRVLPNIIIITFTLRSYTSFGFTKSRNYWCIRVIQLARNSRYA